MKTQYYAAASLDGFIATSDDSLDWLYTLINIEDSTYPQFIKEVGAIAMGSTTYEFLLKQIEPNAWPYSQPVFVFTTRKLKIFEGAQIKFVQGDVRPVHEELKKAANGKNIWIVGGGELAGKFYDVGLLNEIIIQVGSVTLKQGKPFLPRKIAFPKLILNSVEKLGPGMAELRYEIKS